MKKMACIVLPTNNEAENLKRLLPEIFAQAQKTIGYQLHLLVVDDDFRMKLRKSSVSTC